MFSISISLSGDIFTVKSSHTANGAVKNKTKVAKVTKAQVKEIATLKMPDLNAHDVDHAMNMVAGTARSMGFTVED